MQALIEGMQGRNVSRPASIVSIEGPFTDILPFKLENFPCYLMPSPCGVALTLTAMTHWWLKGKRRKVELHFQSGLEWCGEKGAVLHLSALFCSPYMPQKGIILFLAYSHWNQPFSNSSMIQYFKRENWVWNCTMDSAQSYRILLR